MILSCRSCNTKLVLNHKDNVNSYDCETCNQSYPIIGGVPVLVKKPYSFLAKTYIYLNNQIREQNRRIDEITIILETTPQRREVLMSIKNGLKHNLTYVLDLQEIIFPYIKTEDIFNIFNDDDEVSFYGGTLEYLKRDWCWSNEGELELKNIFDTISSFTKRHLKTEKANSLVIGAGAGRTAFDLREIFTNVYAVDSSFCLVSYFYTLLKNNITFKQITERNVYCTKDIVLPFEASLNYTNSSKISESINNFNFFVGYATKIFLPNESVDVINSIYFTDILPFRQLLLEVNRILKTGGLFIHFGPLGYHFTNVEYGFSAEEIKEILQQNNFTILEEIIIPLSHNYTGVSMNKNIMDNWSFIARKNIKSIKKEINYDSILRLMNNVNYESNGVILENGKEESKVNIRLFNNNIYEGSSLILEILRLSNEKSVSEIINEVMEQYNETSEEMKSNIFGLIKDLYNHEIIEICNS